MSAQPVSPKRDVYEQITQAVIEAIESGAGGYRMPWHNLETPVNATNQKPYRGINSVVLWAAAHKHGYAHPQWATYRQWQDLGTQVRKGERSTIVVFWKFLDEHIESEAPDGDEEEQRTLQRRCVARAYHVFNAAQVDGYVPPASCPAFERGTDRACRGLLLANSGNRQTWRRPRLLFRDRRLHPDAGVRTVSVR